MKTPAQQPAVVDILNNLLDVELGSVFQFLGDSALYLDRSTAAFHRPLEEMVMASRRRANELSKMIDDLGATPISRGLQPEEQYLAYLSLKFLLPRLIAAKELAIERWESALRQVGNRSPQASALLANQLTEHQTHLTLLKQPHCGGDFSRHQSSAV